MRVLVTGGAGFIGSHLTDRLLLEGHEVTVLDDLSTGVISNLPKHRRLRIEVGDVADQGAVASVMAGQEVVFHLAAVASVQASVDDPVATNRTNLRGSIVVLEAAKHAGVARLVYASSAAVYGDNAELPVTEAAQTRPLSPYAADKLAGEHYLGHYHRQGWLHGTAFRFFNVFGPRQDPSSPYSGVISIFAERTARGDGVTIFGDGRQTRDFVHVGDLVEVLYRSLSWTRETVLPVVNVGRGVQVSLLQLLDAIEAISGKSVSRTFRPERSGDVRHSLADISRLLARMPEFSPRPLDVGLRSVLEEAPSAA